MQDAQSPLGIAWVQLGLAVGAVLLVVGVIAAVRRRRSLRTDAGALLLGCCLAAALWTLFTVGQEVRVPIAGEHEGAVCLVNALGENPDLTVDWGSDCGRAFAGHLLVSVAPSVVMLGVAVGVLATGIPRGDARRGRPARD